MLENLFPLYLPEKSNIRDSVLILQKQMSQSLHWQTIPYLAVDN